MLKRRRILVLFTVLLLAAAIALFLLTSRPPEEPSYAGQSLSHWLAVYSRAYADPVRTRQAEEAIRRIGTNAIPWLLRWTENYEEIPSWRWRCYDLLDPIVRVLNRSQRAYSYVGFNEPRTYQGQLAEKGFIILGPAAQSAIPELTRLMNDPTRTNMAVQATIALAHLGDEAIPPLITAMTNPSAIARVSAVGWIPATGTNARRAVPVLLNLLGGRDPLLRQVATNSLRRIAPETLRNPSPE